MISLHKGASQLRHFFAEVVKCLQCKDLDLDKSSQTSSIVLFAKYFFQNYKLDCYPIPQSIYPLEISVHFELFWLYFKFNVNIFCQTIFDLAG